MDYVLNEYVHVDWINKESGFYSVFYEPLDELAEPPSVKGMIAGRKRRIEDFEFGIVPVPFRQGSSCLLVDTDDVEFGRYLQNDNRIILTWRHDPGEHYIAASYTIRGCDEEKRPKLFWAKEGF